MSKASKVPGSILVTGSPRSGTTWVGETLASPPGVGYIQEPFNPYDASGKFGLRPDHPFTYIPSSDEDRYEAYIRKMLSFRYDLAAAVRGVIRPRIVFNRIQEGLGFTYHALRGARPLVKDPTAVFSAGWMARKFNMDVVFLVRHPAAVVNSHKRLGWHDDVKKIVDQEGITDDLFPDLRVDIDDFLQRDRSLVQDQAFVWKLVHHALQEMEMEHPNGTWGIHRYEDIARDPVMGFSDLYESLDIDSVEPALREIRGKVAESPGPSEPDANLHGWKDRLNKREVRRIREIVEPEASRFYDDESWAL